MVTTSMSAECIENAANAAAKRRELRRRKLLRSPEERMKKIVGYSLPGNEPVKLHPGDRIGDAADGDSLPEEPDDVPVMRRNGGERVPSVHQRHQDGFSERVDPAHHNHERVPPPAHHQQTMHLNTTGGSTSDDATSNAATSNATALPSLLGNLLSPPGGTEVREESGSAEQHEFNRTRQVLCAALGVLTRLSFLCSIGTEYVQTIVYPFLFLETALLGYQKIIGMDMGSGVTGGLWLSVLVLAGIKRELVQTYRALMGAASAVVDDFTVFFFSFVLVHLFVP